MSETCDHSTESLPHQNKNDSRQNGSESLHTVAEGEPDENSTDDEGAEPGEGVVDLEDIGDMMVKMKKASTVNRRNGEKKKREMVTPEIRQSLSKQGRDILNCILLTSHISPSLLSLSLFLSLSLSLLSLSLSLSLFLSQVIVLLVVIRALNYVGGQSPCCVVVVVATNIPFMASRVIVAWKPRPVSPAQTSVCFVGGKYKLHPLQVCLLICTVFCLSYHSL